MSKIKLTGAQLIQEKIILVNKPEYMEEKQRILDQIADKDGTPRQKARLEKFEYLRIMTEGELHITLLALLPVLSLEEKPAADKCKYLIGTQAGVMMIKTNQIMIRVGGGFATLEDYIK